MSAEARIAPRKAIRCRAKIVLDDKISLDARTVDISSSGICMILAEQLPAGRACLIAFDIPINGKMRKIRAVAKAVYSICSGTEGFRVGFQFVQVDAATTMTITELTRDA